MLNPGTLDHILPLKNRKLLRSIKVKKLGPPFYPIQKKGKITYNHVEAAINSLQQSQFNDCIEYLNYAHNNQDPILTAWKLNIQALYYLKINNRNYMQQGVRKHTYDVQQLANEKLVLAFKFINQIPTQIQLSPFSKVGYSVNHEKLMKTMKIDDTKKRQVQSYGDIKIKKLKAITYMNMNSFQYTYQQGILAIENLYDALMELKNIRRKMIDAKKNPQGQYELDEFLNEMEHDIDHIFMPQYFSDSIQETQVLLGIALFNMGGQELERENYDRSLQHFQKALAFIKEIYGSQDCFTKSILKSIQNAMKAKEKDLDDQTNIYKQRYVQQNALKDIQNKSTYLYEINNYARFSQSDVVFVRQNCNACKVMSPKADEEELQIFQRTEGRKSRQMRFKSSNVQSSTQRSFINQPKQEYSADHINTSHTKCNGCSPQKSFLVTDDQIRQRISVIQKRCSQIENTRKQLQLAISKNSRSQTLQGVYAKNWRSNTNEDDIYNNSPMNKAYKSNYQSIHQEQDNQLVKSDQYDKVLQDMRASRNFRPSQNRILYDLGHSRKQQCDGCSDLTPEKKIKQELSQFDEVKNYFKRKNIGRFKLRNQTRVVNLKKNNLFIPNEAGDDELIVQKRESLGNDVLQKIDFLVYK